MCTNEQIFFFQHTQNKGFMKIFHIKKSIIGQKIYQKINKYPPVKRGVLHFRA